MTDWSDGQTVHGMKVVVGPGSPWVSLIAEKPKCSLCVTRKSHLHHRIFKSKLGPKRP